MRTVVLGANGQLGRDLLPLLSGEVFGWGRNDVDLNHTESLRQKLSSVQPDYVINCAAYNFVDKAESEPEIAFQNNTWAVRQLALICRDLNITHVQISTDYVYGLDTPSQPFSETDAPGPISVYGMSKLSGEYAVRSICPKHFVIRTCGLYGVWGSGGKGGNFVETMLRVASQGKPLRVVADQFCTPSFTADIARGIAILIQTQAYGLYHLTNSGSCSWHQLAAEIFRLSQIQADLTAIPSVDYPTPAKRPPYSVLNNHKINQLGITLRPWQEALAAYLLERKNKKQN